MRFVVSDVKTLLYANPAKPLPCNRILEEADYLFPPRTKSNVEFGRNPTTASRDPDVP